MSPLEYIEKGIFEGNWKFVTEGYERLTGKALPLPIESTMMNKAEEALRKIAEITSITMNQLTGTVQSMPIKTDQYETEIKTVSKKKCGRPKGKKKKTTEEDSSLILNENKKTIVQKEVSGTQLITNKPDLEEIERNKVKAKRANRNKIKLNRKVTTTYDVKCNECEKTFKSNRPKGEIGQKCSECLNEKKSRFV